MLVAGTAFAQEDGGTPAAPPANDVEGLRRELDARALGETQLPLVTRTRVTEFENRPILECRIEQCDKSMAYANARPHQQRIAQ